MSEDDAGTVGLIRAMVRPFITAIFALAWIGITIGLIMEPWVSIGIPYILLTVLAWGVVVWYYDDRTYFHRHTSPLDIIFRWRKQ